jgi:putative acetyltransferase
MSPSTLRTRLGAGNLVQMTLRTATNADIPAIQEHVGTILGEFDLKLDFNKSDADLLDIEAAYTKNRGVFLLVLDAQGNIIGTVGLYQVTEDEAMLRKMYVSPEARGTGLGRKLLEEVLAFAKEAGYESIVLESMNTMHAAIALYQSAGFVEQHCPTVSPRCDKVFRLDLNSVAEKP